MTIDPGIIFFVCVVVGMFGIRLVSLYVTRNLVRNEKASATTTTRRGSRFEKASILLSVVLVVTSIYSQHLLFFVVVVNSFQGKNNSQTLFAIVRTVFWLVLLLSTIAI